MRIDKWLWAARFYKTRSLAVEEIGKGRVRVNGLEAKPSRELRVGDMVELRQQADVGMFKVLGLSAMRGPAPVAQTLYEETVESRARRAASIEQRRLAPEPAHSLEHGRPTKRDRRTIEGQREDHSRGWDDRWSASVDD